MWLLQLSTTDNHNVAIMGGIAIRSYYTNMSEIKTVRNQWSFVITNSNRDIRLL